MLASKTQIPDAMVPKYCSVNATHFPQAIQTCTLKDKQRCTNEKRYLSIVLWRVAAVASCALQKHRNSTNYDKFPNRYIDIKTLTTYRLYVGVGSRTQCDRIDSVLNEITNNVDAVSIVTSPPLLSYLCSAVGLDFAC